MHVELHKESGYGVLLRDAIHRISLICGKYTARMESQRTIRLKCLALTNCILCWSLPTEAQTWKHFFSVIRVKPTHYSNRFDFVCQSMSASSYRFFQVACTLAVAESAVEFKHRDLHWGNILITSTKRGNQLNYSLDGETIAVDGNGLKLAIIDFTLSRMSCNDVCFYNDLSLDPELFTARGDYQFDIYRKMREHNK